MIRRESNRAGAKKPTTILLLTIPFVNRPELKTFISIARRSLQSGATRNTRTRDVEERRGRKERKGAAKNGQKKLPNGIAWESSSLETLQSKAEDKGLEPSTGKPAPDFESGC